MLDRKISIYYDKGFYAKSGNQTYSFREALDNGGETVYHFANENLSSDSLVHVILGFSSDAPFALAMKDHPRELIGAGKSCVSSAIKGRTWFNRDVDISDSDKRTLIDTFK